MDLDKYPNCVCGAKTWDPRGGSYGNPPNVSNFRCKTCGRPGAYLYSQAGTLFIVPKGQDFTPRHDQWLNKVMCVVWRFESAKIDAAREEFEKTQWASYAKAHGWDPKVFPCDWPDEARNDEYHKFLDDYMETPEYRRPLGYRPAPLPPQLPDDLEAWVEDYGSEAPVWGLVDHDAVRDLPVPEDPIYTQHMKYWNEVFTLVGVQLGASLPMPEGIKVPNQNDKSLTDSKPWFQFTWMGYTFTVGPRTCVDVVEVTNPNHKMQKYVERTGVCDKVTYNAEKAYLHAWTREKLVEYMLALMKAA